MNFNKDQIHALDGFSAPSFAFVKRLGKPRPYPMPGILRRCELMGVPMLSFTFRDDAAANRKLVASVLSTDYIGAAAIESVELITPDAVIDDSIANAAAFDLCDERGRKLYEGDRPPCLEGSTHKVFPKLSGAGERP